MDIHGEMEKLEKTYEKTCAVCGKNFTATKNVTKYCDDEKYMKAKRERRLLKSEEQKRIEKSERMRPLREINEKARAAHMSYGQYVAKFG